MVRTKSNPNYAIPSDGEARRIPTKMARSDPAISQRAALTKPSRKYRYHPGTVAGREVVKEQQSTKCLLKYAPMKRIVCGILKDLNPSCPYRITKTAFEALRIGTQDVAVSIFDQCNELVKLKNTETVEDFMIAYVAAKIIGAPKDKAREWSELLRSLKVRRKAFKIAEANRLEQKRQTLLVKKQNNQPLSEEDADSEEDSDTGPEAEVAL